MSDPVKQFWTLTDDGDVQAAAWAFASNLDGSEGERERRDAFLVYASQYLGRPIKSLTDFELSTTSTGSAGVILTGRTKNNLTRTLVDTAMSRFAKSETRVQFLTEGGTPAQQQRSEDATDAANALIEQTGGERELRRAALHACVFDLGYVLQVDGEDGEGPGAEHVPAWEIMYDPADAHRGRPTIQVRRFAADREALVNRFAAPTDEEKADETPKGLRRLDELRALAEEIRESGSVGLVTDDHTPSEQHCLVYELIKLKVGKTPGRRVIVTDKVLCLTEKYTAKKFPGVSFGWSAPVKGPYPESIAAIVSQLQLEIDGIDTRISQCLRLLAVPMWKASGIDTALVVQQLSGGSGAIGDVIQCPPGVTLERVPAGDIMGPELQNRADKLWNRGYEMTGINQNSATGTRPTGLNSAPAQREWNEINQDRLSLVALDYQQAHVDLASLLLDAVAAIPDFEISLKSTNGKWLRKMKAADLNLAAADYVIEKYPIGALPSTPTGKIAAAADLLQMKGIDVDEFRDILNFPDLKAKLNLRRASEKATEKLVNKMLVTGVYEAPPDKLDYPSAAKYATAIWLQGLVDEMPQDQLDMLDQWIGEIKNRLTPDPAPAAGAPDPTKGTSIAPITPAPLAPPPPVGTGLQAAA